jgi:hypothetical protein
MAVAVCGVVFVLCVAAVAAGRDRLGVGSSLREAVVVASALVGGFVVAVTEGLGALGELRFGPVLACWIGFGLGLAASVVMNRRHLSGWWARAIPLDRLDISLLALIAIIVGASGLIAAICPPNNYDVTLYHLPRQVQWLQQGSVAHFPTQDYRLTVNPPFAEFVGLHLMLLSGSDRLATVESWVAMLLTLAAVSLVARELGLSRKGQLLAALFAVTVPIGFHEAANGKNDWTVAFWLAATAFWVLRVWKADRVRVAEAACAGLSVGLLVLTKGTGGVYAVPLALLGGLGLAVRRPRGWTTAALLVGTLALLPSVGHWSRNVAAYGSVSGETFGLGSELQTPSVWASGLVRNVGMHLASPRAAWNRKIDKYVHRVHDWLGLGTEDPHTTWLGVPFKVEYQPRQDDFATAPVHALLLLVAVPVLAVGRRTDPSWLVYLIGTAGGFLLFCAAFKWQPWHPRLHLPVLALGGVAAGWLLTRPQVRWLAPVAAAGLVLSVLPTTQSQARSLGPDGLCVFTSDPDRLRFFNQDAILNDACEIVARVQATHPAAVDLINHEPAPWEYPITLWLRTSDDPPRVSYFYPVAGSPACETPAGVVIDVASPHPPDLIRHPQTREVYRIAERVGRFTIYRPLPPGTEYAGYRLTDGGEWDAIPGQATGGPPVCDHPVARFGIGTEQPRTH